MRQMAKVIGVCSTIAKPADFIIPSEMSTPVTWLPGATFWAISIVKSPVPQATSSTFIGLSSSAISRTAFFLQPVSILRERI